jgi:threonine dehydratase
MARSLVSGGRERNPRTSGSLCDAILTPQPGALTLPVLARLAGPGLVVSDAEAMRAVALAFRHLRLVVEPGGAVALAAALFRPEAISGDTVIVVASGGNVDATRFAEAILAVEPAAALPG